MVDWRDLERQIRGGIDERGGIITKPIEEGWHLIQTAGVTLEKPKEVWATFNPFAKVRDALAKATDDGVSPTNILTGEGGIFGYGGLFWKAGEAITYLPRAFGLLPEAKGQPELGIPFIPDLVMTGVDKVNKGIDYVGGLVEDAKEGAKSVIDPVTDLTNTITDFFGSLKNLLSGELGITQALPVLIPDITMPQISVGGISEDGGFPLTLVLITGAVLGGGYLLLR